jgi:DNA polymerase IV
MAIRKIIHLDLDAFFCAVEELQDPALKGKPFAVGGRPDERGVVASCSYPARMFGVHSAMPMNQALRLCPGLIIVSHRHDLYSQFSSDVMDCIAQRSPLVEQISIDEAFLDISDLPGSGESVARSLQAEINSRLTLPCSLGIASNKLVAKIANDVGKSAGPRGLPPNAIKVVPFGQEAAFLAPLPVSALPGIGKKTASRLEPLGVKTIGDLALLPERELASLFGKNGLEMARHARGSDDRPVITSHTIKSISQETTFARDVSEAETLRRTLFQLAEGVGYRLRKSGLAGTTVKIKIRWPDFSTISRQLTLDQPTSQDGEIFKAASELFLKEWKPGKPVRLLGVGMASLGKPARQVGLWENGLPKEVRLQQAIDDLRDRYGWDALHRAGQIGKKEP